MYPVVGVWDFLIVFTSVGASNNGGRQIDATSLYKSKVCAAVYLKIHHKESENKVVTIISFASYKRREKYFIKLFYELGCYPIK